MNRISSAERRGQVILILAAAFILGVFVADGPAVAAFQETVMLAYRFPAGMALSYQVSSAITQTVSMMGQTADNKVALDMGFSVNPKGMNGQDFKLGVVIDSGKLNVQSPQSAQSSDLSSIRGKGFDMTVSAAGKEIDVSGASDLKVIVDGSQFDIGSYFQAGFPDLPDMPVKVGDKWPSSDIIVARANGIESQERRSSQNILDGFETVDGYACARIKADFSGTISAGTPMGPLSLKTKGSGTWYFAVKEGILVKADWKSAGSGSIRMQGGSANVTAEQTVRARLIRN